MPGPPPGMGQFLKGQLFQMPPVPTGDLTGRTYVITGGNSGLGLDASKHLVRLGASELVLGCRNTEKGEAAKVDILQVNRSAKTKIRVFPVDMNNYESVVEFAHRCSQLDRIDGFIANAGISVKEFKLEEGDESTLTVNVLATFLSAILMLPKLRETAVRNGITPTVAVTGSAVHFTADTSEIKNIPDGAIFATLSNPKMANMGNRYNLSKLFVMMCVQEMSERITKSKETLQKPFITVNNVNPGFCRTNFFRHDESAGQKMALRLIGRSSEQGSRSLVHGVTSGEKTHGVYLSESRIKPASPFVTGIEGHEFQHHLWAEMMAKLERVSPGVSEMI